MNHSLTFNTEPRIYPIVIAGDTWRIAFRSLPAPGVELTGGVPTHDEVLAVMAQSMSALPVVLASVIHIAAHEVAQLRKAAKGCPRCRRRHAYAVYHRWLRCPDIGPPKAGATDQ